nr:MAG TPA_asm: hypothetical protein [Caudoviricetes sp.]
MSCLTQNSSNFDVMFLKNASKLDQHNVKKTVS